MPLGQRALLFLMILTAAVAPQRAAGERIHRATWVWNNDVVGSRAQRDDLLRFCRQRRIDTLFLYAPADHLRERAADFHAFLAEAHRSEVRVEALAGAADWSRDRAKAEEFVAAVRAFNDAAAANERFDGLHLDVEPYDTAEWKASPEKSAAQYLEMLEALRAEAGGLPVAADVPPWYGEIELPEGTLLSGVIDRVDEIGLMAYTDQTKGLAKECRPAVDYASTRNKQVWVGVSAQLYDTDMDPKRGVQPQVERVIKAAERTFKDARSLRGIAIHDYEHLRALYDRRRAAR